MAKYFSASKVAFYDDVIVSVDRMPEDVLLMPEADYNDFMAKQAEGFVIVAGPDGYPAMIKQTGDSCSGLVHEFVTASENVLGHVKIGKNVNVTADGTISVELSKDVGDVRDRDTSKPTYGLN